MMEGAEWVVGKGFGVEEGLEYCEERGAMEGAGPDKVSKRVYGRVRP